MLKYDAVVIGGGFTGVMAACALSREGLKTLLLEKSGTLGGAASLNYVLPFMGYAYRKNEKQDVYLSRGLFLEFIKKMEVYNALKEGIYFDEEYMKLVLDEMTEKYAVDVLFHSVLAEAQVKDEQIEKLRFVNVNGMEEVEAKTFMDATGDGLLYKLAGCTYQVGREEDEKCQMLTLCFRVNNVDVDRYYREDVKELHKLWAEKRERHELLNPRPDILTFRHPCPGVLHFNSTWIVKSPVNIQERSDAEKIGRKEMVELFNFCKENAPSFEKAYLLSSSVEIGVRESRRLEGLYKVNTQDILECKKFKDAVVAGNYEIDVHSPDADTTIHKKVPTGEFYTIPYCACVPQEIKNLYVAGRCISSTHEAQASFRIMPICAAMGEGVAVVAAYAHKNQKANRDVTVEEVEREIQKYDLIEKKEQETDPRWIVQ